MKLKETKEYLTTETYFHGSNNPNLTISDLKFLENDTLFYSTPDLKYAVVYALSNNDSHWLADADNEGYIYEVKFSRDADIFDANNVEDMALLQETLQLTSTEVQALQRNDFLDVEKQYNHLDRISIANALAALKFDGYWNKDIARGYITHVPFYFNRNGNPEIEISRELEFDTESKSLVLFNTNVIKSMKGYKVQDYLWDRNIALGNCFGWIEEPLGFVDWCQ